MGHQVAKANYKTHNVQDNYLCFAALVVGSTPPAVAETKNNNGAVIGLALALGVVLTVAVVVAVIVIVVLVQRNRRDVLSLKQSRFVYLSTATH